jgi:hypothetical protein
MTVVDFAPDLAPFILPRNGLRAVSRMSSFLPAAKLGATARAVAIPGSSTIAEGGGALSSPGAPPARVEVTAPAPSRERRGKGGRPCRSGRPWRLRLARRSANRCAPRRLVFLPDGAGTPGQGNGARWRGHRAGGRGRREAGGLGGAPRAHSWRGRCAPVTTRRGSGSALLAATGVRARSESARQGGGVGRSERWQ